MQPRMYIVPLLFAVAAAAFWAFALVDVFQRDDSEFPSRYPGSNDRVLWTWIVVLTNVIGALPYYLLVMRPNPRRRR